MKLVKQYKNAKAIITQIDNCEFEFEGHLEYEHRKNSFKCYTARRKDVELWCANGWMFFEVRDKPWELGIFRHWVWFAAARKSVIKLEKSMKPKVTDLTA